ncbi:hypothetical protein G9H71_19575, partial [Motilibacter sp. E257]
MTRPTSTRTTARTALAAALVGAAALGASPAPAYAAAPASTATPASPAAVAKDSVYTDTLPPGVWPHLGALKFARAGRHAGALSGACVPAIPAGRERVTARYTPPEGPRAGRAAQTVVELGTATAARDAARRIAKLVPKCLRGGENTRIFPLKNATPTTWAWSTITSVPG